MPLSFYGHNHSAHKHTIITLKPFGSSAKPQALAFDPGHGIGRITDYLRRKFLVFKLIPAVQSARCYSKWAMLY